MTGILNINDIYRRLESGIKDLYYTQNLLKVYIQQQNYISTSTTTLPPFFPTTSTTTTTSSTTSSTTSTTTPTTTPPATNISGISGFISGFPPSFVAGTSYTLFFSPINFNISDAQILWESNVADVFLGANYTFTPKAGGNYWIQTEANLVDGRRIMLDSNIQVNEIVSNYIELYNPNIYSDSTIKEWFRFDGVYSPTISVPISGAFTPYGQTKFDKTSFVFPNRPSGACLSINGITDYIAKTIAPIPAATSLSVECMIYLKQFNPNGVGNASILRLERNWNAFIAFLQDTWAGPSIQCYNGSLVSNTNINTVFPLNTWNHLKFVVNKTGYYVYINGVQKGTVAAINAIDNFLNSNIQLTIGQGIGYVDEVIIKWS